MNERAQTREGEPPVAVLGGGSFGWGLADAAARNGHKVILWSRRPQRPATESITVTGEILELAAAELIFVAVPSAYVAEHVRVLGRRLSGEHFLVHVSRGVVGDELRTLSSVLRGETPCRRIGALGGPLVAEALSAGAPGGAIVGTLFPEVRDAVRAAIGGPSLRIYSTHDVLGVEIASTLVGLLSLIAGYCLERGMGPATLAVMATRGMAEAARIGQNLGARPETFSGLAGVGDLLAAFAGDGRPEVRAGRDLARGVAAPATGSLRGAHVEGVGGARRVADYTARVGIPSPLFQLTAEVLEGKMAGEAMLAALMARRVGEE